ncbi:sulfonate transport system substrate-binding protein [Azotobacter beijerinckii]|uniref:Putative aliphatic sulfonates-binding protein n=1 Tax=Azotobacter beijerinckii TaxID=170623 RepID=A0A1H6Z778_9GAMM|nr:ABC transporter substrate-binding protein [Azotobacter beijerinckii]SEJ49319.1 sulfonate transport system substrate-binding protein [Azotobacter beijerinckii]
MRNASYLQLALAGLLSWSGVAWAQDLQPLWVANQKSGIRLLLEAAGELERVPYSIQFSEFPAAAPLGEALNAGAVDVGGLGDAPYVFALGTGAPLKVISIVHAAGRLSTAIVVPKDSPLQNVADLKGKRIVTGRGSIGHFLALKALRGAGLQSSDVQFIHLLPSDARGVLDSGGADAWSTWDPYTAIAITQGARVLVNGSQLLSNNSYLAATGQAIESKRPQLEDFVKRVERAYRWANRHPDAYAAAQSRVTGLPRETHLESARNTRFQRVPIDDAVIEGLQATADLYFEEGITGKRIEVSQGFDTRFNEAADGPLLPAPSPAFGHR